MIKILNFAFLLTFFTHQLFSQDFWTYLTQFSGRTEFTTNSFNHIFAGTPTGVYRSVNGGNNWVILSLNYNTSTLATNSLGHIFAGTLAGVYLSTNNGDTWTFKGLNNGRSSKITINLSGHIFLADSTGIYVSTNSGNNWVNTLNGPVNRTIISISVNESGNIFVGTSGQIYRSMNNGNSWELINPSQASLSVGLNGNLFAGIYHLSEDNAGGFVIRSTNNGTNWEPLNIPLAGCRYYVRINPYNGYIFAGGTCGLFVYYSSDNGDNWNIIESGLTGNDVITFGFAGNGYIFCGQENGRIYRAFIAPTGITPINSTIPSDYSLSQNYPNPFNPATNIKFQIPKTGFVKLIVFNSLGQEVVTLVNEELQPGTYQTDFDGTNLPSGVYYYKLETNEFSDTKKMVLIK